MTRDNLTLWQRFNLWFRALDDFRLLMLGYASYCLIGAAVLCLPLCHVDGASGSAIDHLFTAVSAVSTTGLVTIPTSDSYSFFGEAVILMLIQLGGIGYMTAGSFLVLTLSGHLPAWRRRVSAAAIAAPGEFDAAGFVRQVVWFTLAIEAVGALLLYLLVFRGSGADSPLWQSVFHSISSFCTAGFGLFSDSFESWRHDTALNVVISALSILGSIGFIVTADLWRSLRSRRVSATLTTKIIITGTAVLLAAGTLMFWLDEPLGQDLPAGERWMAAFFQVMTASTTVGFNTLPVGSLCHASVAMLIILMVIGASPSGTGGGLKTTTVTALWAVASSVIRGKPRAEFLGRTIPANRVRAAVASATFYGLTLGLAVWLLAMTWPNGNQPPLADQIFEVTSALGTVGLSRGITGSLTDWGKLLVVFVMFVGRIGPLGLAYSLSRRVGHDTAVLTLAKKEEDVVV